MQYQDEDLEWFGTTSLMYIADSVIDNTRQIRIKPGTKRIALTQQDLIDRELSNKTMWVKYEQFQCEYYLITSFSPLHVMFAGTEIDYDLLLQFGTFLDGTPCYKEVESE